MSDIELNQRSRDLLERGDTNGRCCRCCEMPLDLAEAAEW